MVAGAAASDEETCTLPREKGRRPQYSRVRGPAGAAGATMSSAMGILCVKIRSCCVRKREWVVAAESVLLLAVAVWEAYEASEARTVALRFAAEAPKMSSALK